MKSKIIQMLEREVALTYKSDVSLSGGKKNEMCNRITKESKIRVLLIGNENTYKNIMLESDPYYIAKSRQWGVRLENGLIDHKNEQYVEMIAKETLDVKYFLDGDLIESSEITGLKESALRAIDFRCVKIANILSIKI